MKPILIILLIALVLGNNIQKEKNPIFRALKGCVNQKIMIVVVPHVMACYI